MTEIECENVERIHLSPSVSSVALLRKVLQRNLWFHISDILNRLSGCHPLKKVSAPCTAVS